MNPLRRDAEHLAYLVRRWFANRRMAREEFADQERRRRAAALGDGTAWTDDELHILGEDGLSDDVLAKPGRRHSGRHARPGDIPHQPPAGRES